MAEILTHALAEELLLSATTREFYGSMPTFQSLHKLFADQYRQLEQWLDQLATRTWNLGSSAQGKMPALAGTRCLELRGQVPPALMVSELLTLHEQLARQLGDDARASRELGDAGSAAILARLVEFHETTAWMLRTVLQGPEHARN